MRDLRSILLLLLFCIAGLAVFGHAHAENQTINETHFVLNYHQDTPTEKNTALNIRIKQGDTVYQGKTYDLTGVTGISYEYAHWNDWKWENFNCKPDKINIVRYYRNQINERSVWLDPEIWSVGNWYYWDSWECNITYFDTVNKTRVFKNQPLQQDNKFAFKIVKGPSIKLPAADPIKFMPLEQYTSAYSTKPLLSDKNISS